MALTPVHISPFVPLNKKSISTKIRRPILKVGCFSLSATSSGVPPLIIEPIQ
jgi:hypothetical protein